MNLDDVIQFVAEQGDGWALPHAQRLLALIPLIAEDRIYDREVITWAVYLHDWGAFRCYAQAGVDHALRSRQVVEAEVLPIAGLSVEQISMLLEIIERHDYRDAYAVGCFEAKVFREADFLEFLGAVGMAREFAWGPADLQVVVKRIHARIAGIQGRFTLPVAQQMAEARIAEMKTFLLQLEQESFGTIQNG